MDAEDDSVIIEEGPSSSIAAKSNETIVLEDCVSPSLRKDDLSDNVIDKMDSTVETADDPCSICLSKKTNESSIDGCNHKFCMTCIIEWLKVAESCPMCKAPVTMVESTLSDGVIVSKTMASIKAEVEAERIATMNREVPLTSEMDAINKAYHAQKRVVNSCCLSKRPSKRDKETYRMETINLNSLRSLKDEMDRMTRKDLIGDIRFRRIIYQDRLVWKELNRPLTFNRFTPSIAVSESTNVWNRVRPFIMRELKIIYRGTPYNLKKGRVPSMEKTASDIFTNMQNYDINHPNFQSAMSTLWVYPNYLNTFTNLLYEFCASGLEMSAFDDNSTYCDRNGSIPSTSIVNDPYPSILNVSSPHPSYHVLSESDDDNDDDIVVTNERQSDSSSSDGISAIYSSVNRANQRSNHRRGHSHSHHSSYFPSFTSSFNERINIPSLQSIWNNLHRAQRNQSSSSSFRNGISNDVARINSTNDNSVSGLLWLDGLMGGNESSNEPGPSNASMNGSNGDIRRRKRKSGDDADRRRKRSNRNRDEDRQESRRIIEPSIIDDDELLMNIRRNEDRIDEDSGDNGDSKDEVNGIERMNKIGIIEGDKQRKKDGRIFEGERVGTRKNSLKYYYERIFDKKDLNETYLQRVISDLNDFKKRLETMSDLAKEKLESINDEDDMNTSIEPSQTLSPKAVVTVPDDDNDEDMNNTHNDEDIQQVDNNEIESIIDDHDEDNTNGNLNSTIQIS